MNNNGDSDVKGLRAGCEQHGLNKKSNTYFKI